MVVTPSLLYFSSPRFKTPAIFKMATTNSKLSRLESIPTELLEAIFLKSLNLNLPLASPHLGATLSSKRTKMAMVLKAFPSNAESDLEHYSELQHILWAGSGEKTKTAIGELQSRLLACRWMTWDLLKLCMETFVVRTLLREFRVQDLPWQEGLPVGRQPYEAVKLPWHGGAPVKESVVRDFVHELFTLKVHSGGRYEDELDNCAYTEDGLMLLRDDTQKIRKHRAKLEANRAEDQPEESMSDDMGEDEEDRVRTGYQCLGVERIHWEDNGLKYKIRDVIVTSSLRTYSWGPIDGTPRISIGVGPRDGLAIVGTRLKCETDPKEVETNSRRWRSLWCQFDTHIPVKLLRGPWTQDRLSFLQALLDGGAYLDTFNEAHREIAKQGLTEAIRENNYRAVDLLIKGAIGSEYSRSREKNYYEPIFTEASFIMDVSDEHRECVKFLFERSTLGVTPDTEHLKLAVIERGCQRNIVKRLLWAEFSDIDRADPAVVHWAKTNKEQGSWLLGELASSGYSDFEQRDDHDVDL